MLAVEIEARLASEQVCCWCPAVLAYATVAHRLLAAALVSHQPVVMEAVCN